MAKENENQQRNKTRKKRIHLKFELYGLICIAISIIAVLQLGVAGQTFIYMFRFSPVNGSSFAFSASF